MTNNFDFENVDLLKIFSLTGCVDSTKIEFIRITGIASANGLLYTVPNGQKATIIHGEWQMQSLGTAGAYHSIMLNDSATGVGTDKWHHVKNISTAITQSIPILIKGIIFNNAIYLNNTVSAGAITSFRFSYSFIILLENL